MSSPDVFDEQLSLRRLGVALRRADWRMFEQGLEKLGAEVAARYPFTRHPEWQAFLQAANDHPTLPEAYKEALREAIASLLSVEVRVPQAAATEGAASAVAIVAGWRSSLRDPALLQAFRAWLLPSENTARAASAGRQLIGRWLDEPGTTLETLVNRANLTLAAAYGGIATTDPHWVDTLMAGLSHVLAHSGDRPPLTKLLEAAAPLGPVSLLVEEPSLLWERFYPEVRFRRTAEEAGSVSLVKLAGSLDWFYCHACYHFASGHAGALQPLAIACPSCAAPAWPLVVPVDNPHFLPPLIRNVWAWGGELLRESGTWVLVDPPAPTEGSFQRWLATSLSADKRVVVVGSDAGVRKAWQALLEERGVTGVTSQGPADEVLGFLLSGGVPELVAEREAPAAEEPEEAPEPVLTPGRKKHRR